MNKVRLKEIKIEYREKVKDFIKPPLLFISLLSRLLSSQRYKIEIYVSGKEKETRVKIYIYQFAYRIIEDLL